MEEPLWIEPNREGTLKKKGDILPLWKQRWFILKNSTLYYFKKKGDCSPEKEIPLDKSIIRKVDMNEISRPYCFEIYSPSIQKNFLIQCTSEDDLNCWIKDIQICSTDIQKKHKFEVFPQDDKIEESQISQMSGKDIYQQVKPTTQHSISFEDIKITVRNSPVPVESVGNRQVTVKKFIAPYNQEELCRVIEIIRSYHHPNIIEVIDCYLEQKSLYPLRIVTEKLNGSLVDILKLYPRVTLDDSQIAYVCREILKGLAFLHKNLQIHRYIKTDNIVVNTLGEIKIGIFHYVEQLLEIGTNDGRSAFLPTPNHLPPEFISGQEYGQKVDIWSVGLLVREMMEGGPIYRESTIPLLKALFLIPSKGIPALKNEEKYSPQLVRFCNRCLEADVDKRPTVEELLQDPFLKKACTAEEFLPISDLARTVELLKDNIILL